MFIAYELKNFGKANLQIIEQANQIIEEYQQQGFILTLRQLYYQFVSRDIIANTIQSYKRLGAIINDARMAGLVSWAAIEDRTRNLEALPSWASPRSIMESVVHQYRIDKWDSQPYRPEVWIEKEALVGVISGVCNELQVPYFACRGYNSQSEQWAAGRRLMGYVESGQMPIIFHLGDHDPSGIDMTRDNADRLALFSEASVQVERLALNIDQIKKYRPPPNPAKITDSRFNGYAKIHGKQSWELDALEPQMIADLVRSAIMDVVDDEAWTRSVEQEEQGRMALHSAMNAM